MLRPLLIIALLGVTTANAQYISSYKKVADRYYAKGDYHSAAEYYGKYLSGNAPGETDYAPYVWQKQGTRIGAISKLPATLVFRIADSYHHLNNFAQAEPWYKLLVEKYVTEYPQSRYWYAACLRAKGDYAGALQQLETFVLKYHIYDEYMQQAHQELDACLYIRRQFNNPDTAVSIKKLNTTINKEGASYAAGWMNNNTLVFTATRADEHKIHRNALYSAAVQNNDFREAQLINLNTPGQQNGAASFTADGQRMYFTAWTQTAAGKKQSAIYLSERKGEGWSEPVLVISSSENARQPQLTADGKYLLFASNREGGIGGYDIWYTELDNRGRAGAITNMGPAVNTSFDEEAPFYHAATNTLVFASKGRVGMGGYDLFAATGSFSSSWKEAQNMGYPVNSVKDDTYFFSKGISLLGDAIISSDRSSACCLELFALHKDDKDTLAGK